MIDVTHMFKSYLSVIFLNFWIINPEPYLIFIDSWPLSGQLRRTSLEPSQLLFGGQVQEVFRTYLCEQCQCTWLRWSQGREQRPVQWGSPLLWSSLSKLGMSHVLRLAHALRGERRWSHQRWGSMHPCGTTWKWNLSDQSLVAWVLVPKHRRALRLSSPRSSWSRRSLPSLSWHQQGSTSAFDQWCSLALRYQVSWKWWFWSLRCPHSSTCTLLGPSPSLEPPFASRRTQEASGAQPATQRQSCPCLRRRGLLSTLRKGLMIP